MQYYLVQAKLPLIVSTTELGLFLLILSSFSFSRSLSAELLPPRARMRQSAAWTEKIFHHNLIFLNLQLK